MTDPQFPDFHKEFHLCWCDTSVLSKPGLDEEAVRSDQRCLSAQCKVTDDYLQSLQHGSLCRPLGEQSVPLASGPIDLSAESTEVTTPEVMSMV